MRRSHRRAVKRVVKIGLLATAAVYLLFLVVVNSLLWSGMVAKWASRSDEDVTITIDHGFAWVLWPTRVHVEDFHMVLDTHTYQLQLDVPEGLLDVALWEIVLKNFHAEEIEADGVRAVVRTKAEPGADALNRLEHYGPIELAVPPIKLGEEPPPKPKDKKLLVEIDQIHASVDLLWVNEFKIDMNGFLQGSLRSISDYEFQVDGARLDIYEGTMTVAGTESAESLDGHVDLDIRPYHAQEEKSVLGDTELGAVLTANILDLGFASPYVAKARPGVRLGGGEGPFDIDAKMDGGEILAGSFVHYETGDLVASMGDLTATASLQARGSVVPRVQAPDGRATQVEATLRSAQLDGQGSIDKVHARVLFGQAEIKGPWPIVATSGVIEGLKLKDVSVLQQLGSSQKGKGKGKSTVLGGSLAGEATWHSTTRNHVQGQASGQASGLRLSLKKSRATFDLDARSKFDLDLDTKTLQLVDAEGRIDNLRLQTPNGDSEGTWIRIDHLQGKWQFSEEQMGAIVWAQMESLRPVFAYAKNTPDLLTELPDVIDNPVTMHLEFRRDGKHKLVELMKVSRNVLDVRGVLYLTGDTRGALLFDSINLGVALNKQGKEFELSADESFLRKHTKGLPAVRPSFSDPAPTRRDDKGQKQAKPASNGSADSGQKRPERTEDADRQRSGSPTP